MNVVIDAATAADVPAMVDVLVEAHLPTEGLVDHLPSAIVARAGTSVVATAAVELYGDAALLRSVAVACSARGRGVGERIARAALDLAHRHGARTVYLLTTTAAGFFADRLAFRSISRDLVPAAVRASVEFAVVCPESAEVMVRQLGPAPALVLFACVQNAGRSQIAAAFFNELAHPTRARAISAGTRPAAHVHPEVVTAMREAGVDLAGARPRPLTDELARTVAFVVTMGCGEACPVVPGVRRRDWDVPDPHGQPADRVREIRDSIRREVEALIATEGWA